MQYESDVSVESKEAPQSEDKRCHMLNSQMCMCRPLDKQKCVRAIFLTSQTYQQDEGVSVITCWPWKAILPSVSSTVVGACSQLACIPVCYLIINHTTAQTVMSHTFCKRYMHHTNPQAKNSNKEAC